MSIKKITNKRSPYYGKWYVRVQPVVNGNRVTVPVQYAKTKRQAELIELKLIDNAQKGFNYSGGNQLLSDAFSAWVNRQKELDRWSPVTERTWRYTEKVVRQYSHGLKVKDCTQDTMRKLIHDYVNDRNISVAAHSCADRVLQQLRTCFLTLEGVTIVKSPIPKKALDFFFRKDRQSVVKDKYVLTDNELAQFKAVIKKDLQRLGINYCVTRLGLWIEAETGMRPQEIQALHFTDLIQDEGHWVFKIGDSYSEIQGKMNGHLKSRKCGEFRLTPPITNELYQAIQDFKNKQASFIEEKNISNPNQLIMLCLADYRLARLGKPVTQRSLNALLKVICKKAKVNSNGLPLTCYTLRTTVASRLARLNDYSYASERLGNSLSVYMRYYVKPLDSGYSDLMDRYLSM